MRKVMSSTESSNISPSFKSKRWICQDELHPDIQTNKTVTDTEAEEAKEKKGKKQHRPNLIYFYHQSCFVIAPSYLHLSVVQRASGCSRSI
jgi:hypothetical protein